MWPDLSARKPGRGSIEEEEEVDGAQALFSWSRFYETVSAKIYG
jgi:hypothetical protein